MNNHNTYLAVTKPIKITEGGRHLGQMGRYAVKEQQAASPVAFKEIQNPETGEWIRQSGGSVCEFLVSAIMQGAS